MQVHTLEVFQKELNESEHLVFQAVHGLQRALQGDYRDVVNMKESSRQRLEALREAAIKVSSAFSWDFFSDRVREGCKLHSVTLNKMIDDELARSLLINTFFVFCLIFVNSE